MRFVIKKYVDKTMLTREKFYPSHWRENFYIRNKGSSSAVTENLQKVIN